MANIDDVDKCIVRELQSNARLSNTELAERSGTSTSPCWRRTRSLEERGVIRGYRADVDRAKVGLGVLAFVSVRIDTHSDKNVNAFENEVAKLSAVVACHSVGGGADYLLQVVCEDLDAYADFSMTQLRRLPGIKAIESNFALTEVKAYAGLPME